MKTLKEKDLIKAHRKGGLKVVAEPARELHPVIKYIERLDGMIKKMGVSNESTEKIITSVTEIIAQSNNQFLQTMTHSNEKLLKQIVELEKTMGDFANQKVNKTVVIAKVQSRDLADRIDTVRFERE